MLLLFSHPCTHARSRSQAHTHDTHKHRTARLRCKSWIGARNRYIYLVSDTNPELAQSRTDTVLPDTPITFCFCPSLLSPSHTHTHAHTRSDVYPLCVTLFFGLCFSFSHTQTEHVMSAHCSLSLSLPLPLPLS